MDMSEANEELELFKDIKKLGIYVVEIMKHNFVIIHYWHVLCI